MLDAYILVGGQSSRMKTDKAQLKLGEQTFAERAVSAVRGGGGVAGRVQFVVGTKQKDETNSLLPIEIPRLTDKVPDKAALGGIYTALADSQNEWTAILACDFPFVTEFFFKRLAEIANKISKEFGAIVPVQTDSRVQPLCAFYRTENCLKIAAELIGKNEAQPARRLAQSVKTRWLDFTEIKDLPGSENFFFNVNSPQDFEKAQKIFDETRQLFF